MKRIVKFITLFILCNIASGMLPLQSSAQVENVNFQVFYDALSPYGQWVDNSNYGYVWIPNAGPDFVPYSSAGHWVLTDVGWTWMSDYEWGWAPFHYGRWNFDNNFGWFWVPGTEWSPAWVIWRQARGYYGWAPLAPGVSLSVAYSVNYRLPYERWVFVADRDFARNDLYMYHVDRSRNMAIINNSIIINNTYSDNVRHSTYYYGPRREDVQYYSGRVIRVNSIRDNDRPTQNMNNNQLNIYRPRVQNVGKEKRIAPAKVYNTNEVKPVANRPNVNKPTNENRQNYQQQGIRQSNEREKGNHNNSQKNLNQTKNNEQSKHEENSQDNNRK